MSKCFERSGIRFQYPSTWTADTEDADDGWTVSVQSPETAFLLVSLRADADNPAEMAELALQAIRSDYQEIDAESAVDTLAGQPAIGHNIDFMTVDTPITCWTRCLDSPGGVVLVICQLSEFDRSRNEPLLRAICQSFEIDEDG